MRPAVLRFLSTLQERVIYSSQSNREAWAALSITSLGLGAMTGVAFYQQVPGLPYLATALTAAAALHVRNSFQIARLKAVCIEVLGSGKLQVRLGNGDSFVIAREDLQVADEAEFPNDFKLLRQVKTQDGREFYISYSAEMTTEGRKLLKMP